MPSATSMFHSYCKQHLEPLGFSRVKTTWGRIINDVYQSIYIERISIGSRICFGVTPLCEEIISVDRGTHELNNLDPLNSLQDSLLLYSKQLTTEVFMENELAKIEKYVIPLFQKCTSCQNSLNPLIELKHLFEEHRLQLLRSWKTSDKASSLYERIRHSTTLFFIALKAKNFQYVKEVLTVMHRSRIPWYNQLPTWLDNEEYEIISNILSLNEKSHWIFWGSIIP